MSLWSRVLMVAAAGAFGASARFLVGQLVERLHPGGLFWGTLAVNLIGCFVFGVTVALAEHSDLISAPMKLMILTGAMGAFTTFSAYAHDTVELYSGRGLFAAASYVTAQNVLGIALCALGLFLGRLAVQ